MPQLLRLRLLLEGIEVPVVSAVTGGGINQPGWATIQIIPTDKILELLPRTLVHLLFYDYLDAKPLKEEAKDPVLAPFIEEGYRLLFTGDLLGFKFVKTQNQRLCVLQCVDHTSYWDSAKLYFHNEASIYPMTLADKQAAFVGAKKVSYDAYYSSPGGKILGLLMKSPPNRAIPGLLGGVVNYMESIGGRAYGPMRSRGINDFFTASELRLKLSRQIGALEEDTTSQRLLAQLTYKRWLNRKIQEQRGQTSARQVMEIMLGIINHEYVSIPAPRYVPPKKEKKPAGKPKAVETTKKEDPGAVLVLKKRIAHLKSNLSVISNVDLMTSSEGKAAVELLHTEHQNSPETEKGIGEAALKLTETGRDRALAGLEHERDAFAFMSKKGGWASGSYTKTSESAYEDQTLLDIRARWLTAISLYEQAIGLKKGSGTGAKVIDIDERLYTTVIRPDIYFCPPPRCNVLFPESYDSFTYQRDYEQEVTRLELTTEKTYVGFSEIDASIANIGQSYRPRYVSPDVPVPLTGRLVSKEAGRAVRFVLPHEKFIGIIPKFLRVPDLSVFPDIAKQQVGKNGKINYQQNLANHLFFKYRFGPRTIGLSGRFNPYLAPGFPALVLDRYLPLTPQDLEALRNGGLEKLESTSVSNRLPTQYLGLVVSVTHSISQEGGTTQVQMSHCRTHREWIEFLGVDVQKITKTAKVPVLRKRQLVVEGTLIQGTGVVIPHTPAKFSKKVTEPFLTGGSPLLEGDTGPGGGKVLSVDYLQGSEALLAPTTETQKFVITGDAKEITGPVDFEHEDVLIVMTEELKTYPKSTKEVRVPPETILRPPWFSAVWTNRNIGCKAYHELLGVGSIVDGVQVGTVTPGRESLLPKEGSECLKDLDAAKVNSLSEKDLQALSDKGNIPQFFGDLTTTISQITGKDVPNPVTPEIFAEIEHGTSIEDAIDKLTLAYSILKTRDFDVQKFIRSYAWRPAATVTQILGSRDLAYDSVGNRVKGEEGFHSRAFGPFEAHARLSPEELKGLSSDTPAPLDPSVDPRKERYEAVLGYAQELRKLGPGVQLG